MIRIVGTNQGQRGDLIMGTVVARAIKEKFPDSHFTLGINKQYEDMSPLFLNHPYIDNIHIWQTYDGWPNSGDINWLQILKPDILLHPMPQHPNSHCWYKLVNHQTESSCIMNGLVPPKDLQCYLNKYFELNNKYKNYICIAPFTAWDKKNISNEKWQWIISYLTFHGNPVIQLGNSNEFKFRNTQQPELSYFDSVKLMLSCKFLICLDGGMNWVASAYNHPTLGLMGLHYDGLESSKLYQPINQNGHYLESDRAENIPNELIFKKIDEMIEKYK